MAKISSTRQIGSIAIGAFLRSASSKKQRPAARQERVVPLVSDLERWMRVERARLSRHADTANKLNGIDRQAWLADVLRRIADHPASRVLELLPWRWEKAADQAVAA